MPQELQSSLRAQEPPEALRTQGREHLLASQQSQPRLALRLLGHFYFGVCERVSNCSCPSQEATGKEREGRTNKRRHREKNNSSQATKVSLCNWEMKVERLEEPQLMEEPQLGEDPEPGEEAQFLDELQLDVVESGSDLDPEDLGSSPDFATNLMLELE